MSLKKKLHSLSLNELSENYEKKLSLFKYEHQHCRQDAITKALKNQKQELEE